ncbi:uncharacterized protein LOC126903472 [Daktulosphaira vitifoliae]|uniref:uncharacterized protein LOC126903472 n=1 Tax=Daktulosphaira vitifoliae TaxID=58002 RepID=UPI0021AAD2AD|nr:uncharacterized protein LOC126903472 [Daktulosphaira vitifoliae]
MSLQSLDYLLQQTKDHEKKNISKSNNKIDLQTPFGLNDLMFDDTEVYSCDQHLTSNVFQLESQNTDECSNISDYINKHLSLLTTNNCKLNNSETMISSETKKKPNENLKIITSNIPLKIKQSHFIKKHGLFSTKPLSKMRLSPLQKKDSGCSIIMGHIYPISKSNSMNEYLSNVLIDTRSRGFKFNTPAPDELVLSWMDIVRQMPNK